MASYGLASASTISDECSMDNEQPVLLTLLSLLPAVMQYNSAFYNATLTACPGGIENKLLVYTDMQF